MARSDNKPDLRQLHFALERLSSVFRSEMRAYATEEGLKLVQLEVLVYLSSANRYSDTAAAICDYLGVTKGTVSQTIAALERGGYLERRTDTDDGRVQHCQLTPKGAQVARRAAPPLLGSLTERDQAQAAGAARSLLVHLQAGRAFRTFGRCDTCAHFTPTQSGQTCGLTGERLFKRDTDKICREHEPVD